MSIQIHSLTLGPFGNNTILLLNEQTQSAIMIDPSFGSSSTFGELHDQGIRLEKILLTHAHFDHIAGVAELSNSATPNLPVLLHPEDLPLWQRGGDGAEFGYSIATCYSIRASLQDGQALHLGEDEIQVRFTPGHTPGHVIFYIPSIQTALVGDLIFRAGVGRTDLPGSDTQALIRRILTQVYTLPDDTILIPGHGPNTSVAYEKLHNPFVTAQS